VAFLTVPNNYRGITPDIYIFAIDNYVNEQKVQTAIQTGAKVMLFFRNYHDDENTLESEMRKIKAFRVRVQDKCTCVDYNNKQAFEQVLSESLVKQADNL